MDYNLCKKLKEAGLKQRYDHNGEEREPTLEELIEAVLDDRSDLELRYNEHNDNIWWVGIHYQANSWEIGKTPSEAVAKLYLKLKGK